MPWTSCVVCLEYHAVVKISPADIVIARSTNEQWSCCVRNDDEMTSNSERAGDGKVVFYDQVLMVVR